MNQPMSRELLCPCTLLAKRLYLIKQAYEYEKETKLHLGSEMSSLAVPQQ